MQKAESNSFLKEYSHCCLCEFPLDALDAKEINPCDVAAWEFSRLDFVIRKE